MRIFTASYDYSHPFERVSLASWRKYPNPMNPNVRSVDILDRKVSPDGRLLTNRLIAAEWNAPGWLEAILGKGVTYIHEESEVDPVNRTMTLRAINLSFSRYVTVEEVCRYEADKNDPGVTHFSQEAQISVLGYTWGGIYKKMESVMHDRIEKQASKGKEAIEHVLDKIESEMKELGESATALATGIEKEVAEVGTSFAGIAESLSAEAARMAEKGFNMVKEEFDGVVGGSVRASAAATAAAANDDDAAAAARSTKAAGESAAK